MDVYLASVGLARSRSHAASLIAEGVVFRGERMVRKPSEEAPEDGCTVTVRTSGFSYVSRGGRKLALALELLPLDVAGMRCVDIGASTGGFTDCLLQRGAAHVVAVDAGVGQLAPSLAADPRVTSREKINARFLQPEITGGLCDLAVTDVSFISQTCILPAAVSVLTETGWYIGLVKPQFECGREALHKNGIVRDRRYHLLALRRVYDTMRTVGLSPCGVWTSPITGGDGNTEFLLAARRGGVCTVSEEKLREVVYETHP